MEMPEKQSAAAGAGKRGFLVQGRGGAPGGKPYRCGNIKASSRSARAFSSVAITLSKS